MADTTNSLMSYLQSRNIAATFEPCAYYGPEEDAVIFYFRNDPDYAKRINKWLTLYLSMDNGELVGCQIKGVGRVLEDLGAFGVEVAHKEVELRILFLAFLKTATDDPRARKYYRELGQVITESNPKLEIPQPA